ncbi:alpha-amylase family glycosyl hydrolase [Nodularia spumigena CS-588/05]|nr:alpha-amylase family glycosyl hydrolase [Nodularia spumigena]MDB9349441.1 alpha-amylase family glycosyl hydrolase [Nodularia spumigena CS-588/01]MDB9351981.1 alpha-amylase family glycosyl hydrolase [Nodularia spumigena CS-588/05]
MGSFSDWQEIPMKKGEDGYFPTKVALEDGIYEYKFRVQSNSWFFEPEQWVDVIDPYATDINGASGKDNGIFRVKDGAIIVDTYVWKHDDKPLLADHELVIYELHVGDFSGGEDDRYARGKYKHVIEKLDYLCELGINAIELMPIKEYPGNYNWGYNPCYFFATESSYGSTVELNRAKLAAAILMTSVGVPLIWMGEEFGEYRPKQPESQSSKIEWSLLANDFNHHLFEYYKGLIHLRKNSHALYTENIDFIHENLEAKVLAYSRWNEEGSPVVVVANFSGNFLSSYHIPNFPCGGTWHEWTGNYQVEAGDDGMITDLAPYEAKVFVWQ